MFAYCGNNPVNRKDPTGQFWITALIVATVAVACTIALSGCSAQPTSDVGAAKPYVDMPGSNDPTSPNCYLLNIYLNRSTVISFLRTFFEVRSFFVEK